MHKRILAMPLKSPD